MFCCRIVVDQFLPRLPACRFVSFRRTRPCPVGPRISLVLASALTCISSHYLGSWRFFNVPHSLPRTSLSLSLSPNKSSTMIRRLWVALCILCHLAFFIADLGATTGSYYSTWTSSPRPVLVHCPLILSLVDPASRDEPPARPGANYVLSTPTTHHEPFYTRFTNHRPASYIIARRCPRACFAGLKVWIVVDNVRTLGQSSQRGSRGVAR